MEINSYNPTSCSKIAGYLTVWLVMGKKIPGILILLVLLSAGISLAIESRDAGAFSGVDLHLAGSEFIGYQLSEDEHTLVFEKGFSMSVGGSDFSSDSAVVWLEAERNEVRGRVYIDVHVRCYLSGNLSTEKGGVAGAIGFVERLAEDGQSMVVRFTINGEVFVTAEKKETADPREMELYKKGLSFDVSVGPEFFVQREALVPEAEKEKKEADAELKSRRFKKRLLEAEKKAAEREAKEPKFRYPVNWAPAGEVKPQLESTRTKDGTSIDTIIGRLYVWQKLDEDGGLLELQADNAVIFREGESGEGIDGEDILGSGSVTAIYVSGDIILTEGQRTIRADEVYYDFLRKKALVINACLRSFDASRQIPIYIRAAQLQQLSENKFFLEDATVTTSEFYQPQISLTASTIILTDTSRIDAEAEKLSDHSFDVEMQDVRLKAGELTIFHWPVMRSNLYRPDVPIKGAHIGNDNTWGTSVETQWHLSRLLGLREPENVETTLFVDHFSKRGFGVGTDIDYKRESNYGRFSSYLIRDSGKDRLGRHSSRKDLEPEKDLRGGVFWQHREFLPYKWQFTTGVSYESDENFVESFSRSDFFTGGERETYVHLKRIEDNWAISILGKARINDFADRLEEMPSIEHHLAGQSLFDDRVTFYSDTQVSRLRQRIGNDHVGIPISEEVFSFVSQRTELDVPLSIGIFKMVPFVASTFGYDDRSGFTRTLVDGSGTGEFGDSQVWLAEVGVRIHPRALWRVYPGVKSRLFNLSKIRHIIEPELTAVFYDESDDVVEQRDILNFGISQRLQTKRGPVGEQRTVDWMRLDTDFTWVNNSADSSSGPDEFIWSKPIVPMRVFSAPEIFNGDLISGAGLRRFEMFGPRRNYFGADYIWRISDTAAILSDLNFDMQSSVVQQFDVGFSRLVWPNLSYYIGSRYLRDVEVLNEKGSNSFTFAATYVLDPRYTLVLAQQFDFDYGSNMRSDITLIRRYHRMYCGFTYSADGSLDRQAIVFSIWPQGVPELAIGPRRYMGIAGQN